MILKLLKGAQPALLVFVPVFAVLLWLKYLLIPQQVVIGFEPNPMPFYSLLASWLGSHVFVSKLVTLVLLIIIGLWLSRLNTKFIILGSRTYLPTFIFLIIISSYLPLQQMNPAVFACFFLVWCMEIMFETFKKEGLALSFFQAAFLVSVASLFYAHSAYMMVIIWAALIVLRAFNWREWVLTLLGFVVPYIFLFSYYYMTGQDFRDNWMLIVENILPVRQSGLLNMYYMIFYGFLLLLIIASSLRMISAYQGLKIYRRKFYNLNLWLFIISVIVYSLLYSRSVEFIFFMAVPVSYILTDYFFHMRSRLAGEIFMGILLALYGVILVYN